MSFSEAKRSGLALDMGTEYCDDFTVEILFRHSTNLGLE
jgi:hypothetical protein